MSQTPETQRAIIAGVYLHKPKEILEARARLVVPEKITSLEAPGMQFILDGRFDKNGYFFLGGLRLRLPMKDEYRSPLDIQPEPEDHPKLISLLDARWIILKDGRVYSRIIPPDQTYSDALTEIHYRRENLIIDRPLDFQTMWDRVGRQLKILVS